MEARARSASVVDAGATAPSAPTAAPTLPTGASRGAARRTRGRPVDRVTPPRGRAAERPTDLTRSQEYRYIRADLRRLLITAAALLVVMLALLVVIEL